MKLWIKPHKLKCDYCGEIIDSGVVNCSNHMGVCKGRETVKFSSVVSAIFTPKWSFTQIPNEEDAPHKK